MRSREREKHRGEVTWAAYMPHDAEKAPSDFGKAQDLDQLLRKVRIRALPVRALVALSLEISYQTMASEISDAFGRASNADSSSMCRGDFAIGIDARPYHSHACPGTKLQTAENVTNSSRARFGHARAAERGARASEHLKVAHQTRTRARCVELTSRSVSLFGPIIGAHAHEQSTKQLGT